MKWTAAVLVAALISVAPVFGGGLSEKSQAASLSFNWTDVDDVGETTILNASWLYGFSEGHVQVGAFLDYLDIEDDFGDSVDATSIGPVVEINFLPDRVVTPFVGGFVGTVGGDAGDIYDFAYGVGAGAKAFVGDSASVNFVLSWSSLSADEDGFDDLDTTALSVGLSIYFGGR